MRRGILSVVGNTPLIELTRLFQHSDIHFFVKLEQLNPGGSTKDRPAMHIITEGLRTGAINSETVVVESSSGNMGIGLAQVCAYYKLRFICVVDKKTTIQNINLLRAYNAEIELICEADPATGEFLPARIRRVQEILATYEHAFWPNQYANELNAMAHHYTMHEIMVSLDGKLDYLFCAASTCGTLRGCAEYKRQHNLSTRIIAVDAVGSAIFGGKRAKRLIPGHGSALVPALFQSDLADEFILVDDKECIVGCHRVAREEALLPGGSSGAIVMAVERMLPRLRPGSICAAIFPDRGERYLDTIYHPGWIKEHFGDIPCLWTQPVKTRAHAPAMF